MVNKNSKINPKKQRHPEMKLTGVMAEELKFEDETQNYFTL